MVVVIRGTLGGVVPVRVNTRHVTRDSRDGELIGVYAVNIKNVRNPAGTVLFSNESLVYDVDGSYVYFCDTSRAGFAAGDHQVEAEIRINSTDPPLRRDFMLRLVDQGAP